MEAKVQARLSPSEKAQVERKAARAGATVSEYVRRRLLDDASAVDPEQIAREFAVIAERIDSLESRVGTVLEMIDSQNADFEKFREGLKPALSQIFNEIRKGKT